MNHQQVLHGFLLEDRAALCAALSAKTVDLAAFRRRGVKKMRTGPNPSSFALTPQKANGAGRQLIAENQKLK
jgi:hypothetical protein